jgi:hypothetical protein
MGKPGGNSASASGLRHRRGPAESDPDLAVKTGIRVDLPPALRDQLLRKATVAVRARLLPATTITQPAPVSSPQSRQLQPSAIARSHHLKGDKIK